MKVEVKYSGLEDRQVKVAENEALGFIMLYDNFDDPDWKHGDPIIGTMTFTDEQPPQVTPEPPRSTHISILVAVDPTKARPAKVKRVWEGREYFYDCFATQSVKDEYVAGKIAIGDYVIVYFDDMGEQVVTAKVWKSW